MRPNSSNIPGEKRQAAFRAEHAKPGTTALYVRVAALGHGKHTDMTPDEAIEVALVNQPNEPNGWSPEAHDLGLQRGDWVSVTPDDYGNPVHGTILAWTADEIVIRHEDPSVGQVNVHFPRVGFDVAPAQRLAA
jgi:glutathione S-transferase